MKKKVLLMLAIVCAAVADLSAAPVTKQQALAKAQTFMQSKGIVLKGELNAVNGPKRVGALRDDEAAYYVFNNRQNGGFVIVSGDSRTKDILAYSDTGTFDMDNMSPEMAYILETYAHDIGLLGVDNSENESGGILMRSAGAVTQTPVQPLLTSKWDQGAPYNRTAPIYTYSSGTTARCYAGCVGSAVAQIVYYYRNRLPAKTQVEIPAYTCSNGVKVPKVAKGTAFNWSSMWDEYVASLTTTQLNAVANLVFYCGSACKSEFGPSKTNAPLSKVKSALVDYFGFSSDIKLVTRSDYTAQRWEQLLIDELVAGRPIFFNGISYSVNHAFLLDGYDGAGYFHVNWGWGGRANGYFAINILNPESERGSSAEVDSDSFTSKQSAYIGAQPINGYFDNVDIPELTSTINTVKTATVTVTYKNNTNATAKFKCGLGFADAEGIPQPLKEWTEGWVSVPKASSVGTVSYTLAASDFTKAGLKKATYEVFPIYKVDGDDEWSRCPNTTSNYISATYGTSVSASLATYSHSLKASDFYFSGSHIKSYSQPVHFKLTNEGNKDYNGNVYLFASTSTTKGSYTSRAPIMLGAGQSVDVMLSFKPGSAATYNVWVARDASGTNVVGTAKVTITKGTYKRSLKVKSLTIENTNPSKPKEVLVNQIKGKAVISNTGTGTYSDKVNVFLYRKKLSGGSYGVIFEDVKYIVLGEGEETTVDFEFNNLSPEYYYGVVFYYWVDWGALSNSSWLGYTLKQSIIQYDSEGNLSAYTPDGKYTVPDNVVAVDFNGLASSVTSVVPNKNPNTLYFMKSNEGSPKGLTGKNVVQGDLANVINITDGYPFYSPRQFTANKATYTRTSAIGTEGNGGWEVLILPFDASKISYDGVELKWFKSNEDTGKNLWIKEFSSIQGYGSVAFDFAQEIVGNRPYIMAVPGNKWGSVYNLVGKPLEFSATSVTIKKTQDLVVGSDVYRFYGSYQAAHKVAAYQLDSKGQNFVFSTSNVKPFRGYFISTSADDDNYTNLVIGSETGIEELTMMPFAAEGETVAVYNISGVKVATVKVNNGSIQLDGLPKGIYIINGHKLIK